jgi:hypothetical protein
VVYLISLAYLFDFRSPWSGSRGCDLSDLWVLRKNMLPGIPIPESQKKILVAEKGKRAAVRGSTTSTVSNVKFKLNPLSKTYPRSIRIGQAFDAIRLWRWARVVCPDESAEWDIFRHPLKPQTTSGRPGFETARVGTAPDSEDWDKLSMMKWLNE